MPKIGFHCTTATVDGTLEQTIVINGWHPVKLNQLMGRHPLAIHKAKQLDCEILQLVCRSERVVPATGKRRLRTTLWGWPRGRKPDPDAFDKSLHDALVACKLIVDDSDRWLQAERPQIIGSDLVVTRIVLLDVAS